MFEILFRASYGATREQLEVYNDNIRHGRWRSKPFDRDDPFKRVGVFTTLRVVQLHHSGSRNWRESADCIATDWPFVGLEVAEWDAGAFRFV
jgi:DNA ligase-4